jgi:hypothetical protein
MEEWFYISTFSWPRHYLEVSGQLDAPVALPPGKSLRHPLDRRLCGPQSRCGRRGENSWPYRDSNSDPSCPARSQSLHRLHYLGSPIFRTRKSKIKSNTENDVWWREEWRSMICGIVEECNYRQKAYVSLFTMGSTIMHFGHSENEFLR